MTFSNNFIYLPIFFSSMFHPTRGYMAGVEFGIDKFEVLNRDQIAEGDCCDSKHINGVYNPCDLIFNVFDCRETNGGGYDCVKKIDRFYAPFNEDLVLFTPKIPQPVTMFNMIGGFPTKFMIRVTVFDADDGIWSGDDFIGEYEFELTPEDLATGGKAYAREKIKVITRPDHSEITFWYKAYCLDFECRSNVGLTKLPARFGEGANLRQSELMKPAKDLNEKPVSTKTIIKSAGNERETPIIDFTKKRARRDKIL